MLRDDVELCSTGIADRSGPSKSSQTFLHFSLEPSPLALLQKLAAWLPDVCVSWQKCRALPFFSLQQQSRGVSGTVAIRFATETGGLAT